jgi:hypothetical protein
MYEFTLLAPIDLSAAQDGLGGNWLGFGWPLRDCRHDHGSR